jgi:hypothetical protein
MASNGELTGGSEPREPSSIERSVVRALCLTINVGGSIVKDKMLDNLAEGHFSTPIDRALFAAIRELHERGEYVVVSNLEEELKTRGVKIPESLSLEDLFRGDSPKPVEVAEWVARLRGEPFTEQVPESRVAVEPQPGGIAAPVAPAPAASREPRAESRESSARGARPVPEARRIGPEKERPAKARPAQPERGKAAPRPPVPVALSSEGEEWADYLQAVVAKQGKILETGFSRLDEAMGGLSPGFMVVVDQDPDRLTSFLKQLTDQIAERSKVPCLYLSFGLPKAALRVRTLSRLSGIPANNIEKGRIKKGSPEWESVERKGQAAAGWLKWIFVVDAEAEMGLGQVQQMGFQLQESNAASTCVVVVDTLEAMAKRGESPQTLVAGFKEASESLDALVIAASTNADLASQPGADYVASLSAGKGTVQLEVTRREDSRSAIIRFEHRPDIHRFTEQPAS